ncbi:hypothetical protein [Flavobacterium sp. M31R6]|uniref:hypothetical protein n=1 Tax=Flavobacterium sp. M31R6 TaxID=2739062 RepID=UPI001568DAA1|nr:hypothetical protein [Flavobacterium sp. M31R6]QKJ63834.1 hypothetical protein HQN62_12070 [Flavobacterium sp. M31R6]
MTARINYKKPVSSDSGFLQILRTNWLLLVALLLAMPVLYRWITNLIAQMKGANLSAEKIVNNAENGKSSPVIITKKSFDIFKKYPNVKPSEMERYKAVAQKVAVALGTNVEDNHFIVNTDLYNVNAWFEDEKTVVGLLKTVPTTFPIVEDLYYNVFTRSRNLKTDLYKYLGVEELVQIRGVFKKYGKNWL